MDGLMGLHRPQKRRSLTYRVYCELVCALKMRIKRRDAIRSVAENFGLRRRAVKDIYDRFVRKNLRDGHLVQDLF